ncbi:peptide deformylase [Gloeocapsa sp. PCC 73106]|uniref:peptide deformylase n=1 Tax=Gloeocapsa sp. PCC 73106 TaxID=102232 RepID=UPI0002ACF082|nr:peptide deformylase [Gloeocapsa sp. PCC 73106]ELR96996.1 peptide deformylase [Gloeocapsa sp. PCC 73106]
MISHLEVLTLGHPQLRCPAQPIFDFTNLDLQNFIDALIEITLSSQGVGIAAPQVGRSDRLMIIASHPNPRYPDAPLMEPVAMLNPRLIGHSADLVEGSEGCLSVPGVRGIVSRYQTVEIEYFDRQGKLQQRQLTDFVARIFQHELDHLNGVLFVDRALKSSVTKC